MVYKTVRLRPLRRVISAAKSWIIIYYITHALEALPPTYMIKKILLFFFSCYYEINVAKIMQRGNMTKYEITLAQTCWAKLEALFKVAYYSLHWFFIHKSKSLWFVNVMYMSVGQGTLNEIILFHHIFLCNDEVSCFSFFLLSFYTFRHGLIQRFRSF